MYANEIETKRKKITWIIWRKIIAVIYATYVLPVHHIYKVFKISSVRK